MLQSPEAANQPQRLPPLKATNVSLRIHHLVRAPNSVTLNRNILNLGTRLGRSHETLYQTTALYEYPVAPIHQYGTYRTLAETLRAQRTQ